MTENPIKDRWGELVHWRAIQRGGLWFAETGRVGALSDEIAWYTFGAARRVKEDAEALAYERAKYLARAGA